jgi:hypothetical protein
MKSAINNKMGVKIIFLALIGLGIFYFFKQPSVKEGFTTVGWNADSKNFWGRIITNYIASNEEWSFGQRYNMLNWLMRNRITLTAAQRKALSNIYQTERDYNRTIKWTGTNLWKFPFLNKTLND